MFEQNQSPQSAQQPISSPKPSVVELPAVEISSKSIPNLTPPEEELDVDTPELAKKEIIQEAEEVGGSLMEEKIYTMPEKFKKIKTKFSGERGNKKYLILTVLIVILLVGGGLGFYFWSQSYYQTPEKIRPKEEPVSEQEVLPEQEKLAPEEEGLISDQEKERAPEEEVALSKEQTLKVELKEEPGLPAIGETGGETGVEKILSYAEFYLPEGALPDLNIQINLTGLSPKELELFLAENPEKKLAFKESSYQIVGGLYKIEPVDIIFKSPGVVLKVFYHQELVDEKWENDLTLGYFKDNLWTPLTSSLDVKNNILTADFTVLPSDTLGIIVSKEKLIPKVEEFQIAPNIMSSADSDNDGLTDVEENVFSTEINNPDSDADGSPDGQEIIGLMHPLSPGESKLATSGLINVYTNPTFSYSFFYPATWLARALPETDNQEVLVITNTGEFFSITVEDNLERLSPIDWYLRQSPKVDKNLLFETTVNASNAVWNPDRLTIYIAKENRVYILSYNTGTGKEANFKTVFEMLINSFQFVIQPQGRPDGTLIKYPDKPEIYLIEKGLKRAFQSGEIFERLGFKWENVIEIPLSETYTDGEIINGRLDGTLIKYPDSAAIYLIEGGKKRSFKSGEVFESLGYKWDDIIEISNDEIYPDGPIIESGLTTILSD